jgi:hypothetical protein
MRDPWGAFVGTAGWWVFGLLAALLVTLAFLRRDR